MEEKDRLAMQTDFLKSIEHLRISVFDARIGEMAQVINLWDADQYRPHLVDSVITFLYWDKDVSDFSGYYRLTHSPSATHAASAPEDHTHPQPPEYP